MPWKRNVLVVANVTAASQELLSELSTRAQRGPASFTLIVPATPFGGGRASAEAKLAEAVARLREAGLDAEGRVGDADPVIAVTEAWDPKKYDEIVVSTLPMRVSKWLRAGLPERIEKLTGAPVAHVVSEPRPVIETTPAPTREDRASSLGALSVLGWGGHKQE